MDHERPEAAVDTATDAYSIEDEYVVESDNSGAGTRYGTFCADGFKHAARQAQTAHPGEDLRCLHVTHVETGDSRWVDLPPTGQDPDGTIDVATPTPTPGVEMEMETVPDPIEETLAEHRHLFEAHPVIGNDDDPDVIYEVPSTDAHFVEETALAEYLEELAEYPKHRVATATVTVTFPFDALSPETDEYEVAEEIVTQEIDAEGLAVEAVDIETVQEPDTPDHEVFQ